MTVLRTLLIGLDGATFTVLDPLMDRGVMPFLRDFVAGGARASLRSVMPPLTPPGWTSLVTGRRPGQHGVFDFFQKEDPHSKYFRFVGSHDVNSATIWSLASEHGQRVIALNFPVMFPPPDVNGCVVPGGWMPWRQLRLGCHPPGLFDRLRTLSSFKPRELALDMALEAKAIEGCNDEEYVDWIQLHIRREERWFEILRHLMREEPGELAGVIFDGVDKLQHLCWRFIDHDFWPQDPSPWEREIIELCESYFRRLDTLIADLVAHAGPDATVVLASDHGFGPTFDLFYVNAWLEQQGYLAWAADSPAESDDALQIGFHQMTRHVFELDWDRTIAYAATPSSQGIHIVSQRPGSESPMTADTRHKIGKEITEKLRAITHPVTGKPLVSEVWTRQDAFAGPYEELAPDISIILDEGAAISILRSETVLRRRPEPKGSHRWEGILLARGPSIRQGVSVDELSILDVAPLILYALDLPVPLDMAGRLPEQVLRPDHLQRRPPQAMSVTPPRRAPEPAPEEFVYDADAEQTVLNRLRALGYVD